MLKRILACFFSALLLFTLTACTAKITTVRPAEIYELRLERMADGAVVTLPSAEHSADLKDTLIFQLEEPYNATGKCSEADDHIYRVTLYIGFDMRKIDTEVYLNGDGSVCKGGKRYVPSDIATDPVNIEDWNALF